MLASIVYLRLSFAEPRWGVDRLSLMNRFLKEGGLTAKGGFFLPPALRTFRTNGCPFRGNINNASTFALRSWICSGSYDLCSDVRDNT